MSSTGLVNYCHSVSPRHPHIPYSPAPIGPAKQRQGQPQQLHPKGPSLHQCLTSATASFCISRSPALCYVSLSPSPLPPPPLVLSFIKAFLAILFPSSTESYCSRQRSRSFIFSPQPGLCMHAGLVLPYDIQALSIKYA